MSRSRSIILIAFEEYNNLGMGYLSAVLQKEGFKVKVVDIRSDNDEILRIVKRIDPFIIGFSVIFQYYISRFRDIAKLLRKNGVSCHFTAGGYFASLQHEALFKMMPSLDSAVRFEGEYTILELVMSLKNGSDLKSIKGLAYRKGSKIETNPLRPFETDLDTFPYPYKKSYPVYAFDKKLAAITAGRGCVHNCAYCNTRKFNSLPPGPVKRLRKPELVVEEMKFMYDNYDCSVFLFQDDDFPVKTRNGSEWISIFCNEIIRQKLHRKILWKINCRPDEVSEPAFEFMKRCGLFLVFVGIEDGTDEGLKSLNRNMTIARCLKGINILKKLEIGFDYGYMLFQPESSLKSIHKNISFLKEICSDGYTPVTFLKLMPYFDTKIEKELRESGRLKGRPGFRDYDFPEESMNNYFRFISKCFMKWQRDAEGLANVAKWTRNYFTVYKRYYKSGSEFRSLEREFKKVIVESNLFLIDTMANLAVVFDSGKINGDELKLRQYSDSVKLTHSRCLKKIKECLEELVSLTDEFPPIWLI